MAAIALLAFIACEKIINSSPAVNQGDPDFLVGVFHYTPRISTAESFRLNPLAVDLKVMISPTAGFMAFEHYLIKNSTADFSHGICPTYLKKHHPKIASP